MHIYYVKARFKLDGDEASKQGYILAKSVFDAFQFAGDKIRTYGKKVDIHFMEGDLRNEQLNVVECAKKQPKDHWDKLFSLTTKKH